MFSAKWFFDLDSKLRALGLDSDAQSFDDILKNLKQRKICLPDEFADNCDTDKLIEYAYHYSECYVVPMLVDKHKQKDKHDDGLTKALDDLQNFALESFCNNARKLAALQAEEYKH